MTKFSDEYLQKFMYTQIILALPPLLKTANYHFFNLSNRIINLQTFFVKKKVDSVQYFEDMTNTFNIYFTPL